MLEDQRHAETRPRRNSLRFALALLALVVVALPGAARAASPGSLDDNFGAGGVITTDFGGHDAATALALQPDGKTVVVGQTASVSNADWAVARYDPDGSLDPSFGSSGTVTTDFGGRQDAALAVVIQRDGKIVVAGHADPVQTASLTLPSPATTPTGRSTLASEPTAGSRRTSGASTTAARLLSARTASSSSRARLVTMDSRSSATKPTDRSIRASEAAARPGRRSTGVDSPRLSACRRMASWSWVDTQLPPSRAMISRSPASTLTARLT